MFKSKKLNNGQSDYSKQPELILTRGILGRSKEITGRIFGAGESGGNSDKEYEAIGQRERSKDGMTTIVNIYPLSTDHDPATIITNRQGLQALKEAAEEMLKDDGLNGNDQFLSVMNSAGEEYILHLAVIDETSMALLKKP